MPTLDIEGLTLPERLDLLARLWDSIDSQSVPVRPAQREELDRRLNTADADLATSVPWEKLRIELANRRV
jgi:putative addiction module component (TIGR02574 family)